MTLSPENQAALAKDRREALIRAGVPVNYIDLRLSAVGAVGQEAADWLLGEGTKEVRDGKTVLIQGPTLTSLKLFYVFGRAIHVSDISLRVVTPLELAYTLLDRDYEEIEKLRRVHVLMLNPFQGTDESPFTTGTQKHSVQDFLLARLHEKKSHVLLNRVADKPWWSSDFREILTDNAKLFQVKK